MVSLCVFASIICTRAGQQMEEAAALTASEQLVQIGMIRAEAAEAALVASEQRTSFNHQMARATLEAIGMKAAYDKLACDNIEERRIAAQVCHPRAFLFILQPVYAW